MEDLAFSVPPPSGQTNICNIPQIIFHQLTRWLDIVDTFNWKTLISVMPENFFTQDQVHQFELAGFAIGQSSSHALLLHMGMRGQRVHDLINYLEVMKHEKALTLLKSYEPIEIVSQPISSSCVKVGSQLQLECLARGFPSPNYQWFKGKEEVPNGKDKILVIQSVSLNDAGHYICRIHNRNRRKRGPSNYQFTTWVQVSVVPSIPLPVQEHGISGIIEDMKDLNCSFRARPCISCHPESLEQTINDEAVLTCFATGTPSPEYQWFKDQKPLPGETSRELKFSSLQASHGGHYQCLVKNSEGEDWSKSALLKILPLPQFKIPDVPEIIHHPTVPATLIAIGTSFTLNCTASGKGPLTYTWLKNGLPLQNSSKGPPNQLNFYQVFDRNIEGRYICEVKNKLGRVISREAIVRLGMANPDTVYVAQDKVALLIGNFSYKVLKELTTPLKDVVALGKILRYLDFKVMSLINLSKIEMLNAINQFLKLLGDGVYAVFYYAGHGFEKSGQSYLLPVDVDEKHLTSDCVCVESILTQMQKSNTSLNLIMLDMCRRLPTNSLGKEIPDVYMPTIKRNIVFVYATCCHGNAYEMQGRENGIFMEYLKRFIHKPIPIKDVINCMFKELELDPHAGEIQIPEMRVNLTRDLSLADKIVVTDQNCAFDARTLLWHQAHELPQPTILILKDFNIQLRLEFLQHCDIFCNVMDILIKINEPNDYIGTYDVRFKFPSELCCLSWTCKKERIFSFQLFNLQKLKIPLCGLLQVIDRHKNMEIYCKEMNFGEPLIMKCCLWESSQHLVPMESEEPLGIP